MHGADVFNRVAQRRENSPVRMGDTDKEIMGNGVIKRKLPDMVLKGWSVPGNVLAQT